MEPTQCALWKKNNIDPIDLNLEILQIFTRSAHIERDLFKCRECGQLYFHEWYEHLNFKQGNSMYDTYIPIKAQSELAPLLAARGSSDLAKFIPQLHGSFTNSAEETLQWIKTAPQQ